MRSVSIGPRFPVRAYSFSRTTAAGGGIYNALAGKQNSLTIDSSPTASSTNPVTSGGVYTALAGKAAASHTHPAMTGADSNTAGTAGFVPAPAAGDNGKFLRGDGTWVSLTIDQI